jgi:superfamily I DNA/RNA helicase
MSQTIRFDNVYVSPRVRVALHSVLDTHSAKKFWDLVNKLRTGLFNTPGMRVERLRTTKGKVYSARLNIDMRVIFSMYTDGQTNSRSLVVWDANHHDAAYDRIERTVVPTVFQPSNNFLEPEQIWSHTDKNLEELETEEPDAEELTDGMLLFRVPYYVLAEPNRYQSFEKNIDRYLRLSEEQEELLQKSDRAYLVRGSAGTGKTSLALFYALNLFEQNPEDNIYFFTYQDELACVCRCYKTNLLEEQSIEDASGDFHVFSYLEFCRHYFKQHLDQRKISWKWIDRDASIKHLREIIGTRSRWVRTIKPENLYSYIYSILKGRFVPGTENLPQTSEDFQRIFKGYGSNPHNLDDLMEIFGHYEERLARLKQRDEADLIKYCYQTLKDRAVFSEDERATWILIDELQDFTELEWKSILLFWENQCFRDKARPSFPFLCGDRNQNISRSGFRWQEADSYVERVLREIHRPNAIEKVQLHRNFRNTQQIFHLANFLRSSAPEIEADLGLPPEHEGKKPQLVIGDYSEFVRFLKLLNDPYDEKLPAPMVILFEDQEALESARNSVVDDDGLFFMPLQSSKGLEFEDLIVYRLFSSLEDFQKDDLTGDEASRIFDLWYMAITRARQNLLMYLTPDDLQRLKEVLGSRFDEFMNLVEVHTVNVQSELLNFYHQRERYLPNYSIIFLERTKANEIWQQFRDEQEQEEGSARARDLKMKALKLWKRCRDLTSLGKAHAEVGEYLEAIPYLRQVSMFSEVADCYENLGKFDLAAQNWEKAGDTLDAARCYEKSKQYHDAARMYEMQEQWLQAATNYYLSGDNLKAAESFQNAKMWQSAADLFRTKSQWLKAAELYQKCDAFEQAGDMYLKLKDKLDAARCYQKAELFAKAAALYENLMRWSEGAECYERAGTLDKAGLLYSKAGRLKDAARCKENSGDLVSAAAAYERMKNWERAAYAYVQLKQPAKAAECFEQDGNWTQALAEWEKAGHHHNIARSLEHLGRNADAAISYQTAGAWLEAAHCFEKCEMFAEAADHYLKGNNFGGAASMLARLGRRMDAAKLYLLAGQAAVAAEVCTNKHGKPGEKDLTHDLILWVEQSKKWDAAGALYEALGMMPRAVDKYRQAMMLSKAAECAEKGGMHDIAAELHLQEGRVDKAAYCFQQSQQLKKAAQCYELLKKWQEARDLYEQLNDDEGVQRCQTAANWL